MLPSLYVLLVGINFVNADWNTMVVDKVPPVQHDTIVIDVDNIPLTFCVSAFPIILLLFLIPEKLSRQSGGRNMNRLESVFLRIIRLLIKLLRMKHHVRMPMKQNRIRILLHKVDEVRPIDCTPISIPKN